MVQCAVPQKTTWQFWVFTKNAGLGGAMQVYQNGVQLSGTPVAGSVPKGAWTKLPTRFWG